MAAPIVAESAQDFLRIRAESLRVQAGMDRTEASNLSIEAAHHRARADRADDLASKCEAAADALDAQEATNG